MGHRVAAATGRPEERPFPEELGAPRIVERPALATEIGLSEISPWSERILAGQVRGRVVVDVRR